MASRLARYQAHHSSLLTNQRHEPVGVDPTAREIMCFVDGRHTRMAIIDSVRTLFERGKINVQQERRPVMDRASVVQLVPELVDQVLTFLAGRALLVA